MMLIRFKKWLGSESFTVIAGLLEFYPIDRFLTTPWRLTSRKAI